MHYGFLLIRRNSLRFVTEILKKIKNFISSTEKPTFIIQIILIQKLLKH